MSIYASVIEMIGNTPMLELRHFKTGPCKLLLKLEAQNPGGSIKDRIGLSMIEAAEQNGDIQPGGTIIEATAGNTGLGLALVAAQKGYKMLVIVPDKMSQEKIFHLNALGAQVMMTRSDVTKGHPEYYQDVAERLAGEMENSFWVNQFANPANPAAHEQGTGPEIWEQTAGEIDAMVCGVGSGGTITGLARYFKGVKPSVEMILADPEGSILAGLVNDGVAGELGSWVVEGIGEDFVPPNCDIDLITKAYSIPDYESLATARELLAVEGVLAGSSTGTLLSAALRYCREQTSAKTVVCLMPDSGNKYLSKMFNDFWMTDQGFIQRPQHGDLRDLISRSFDDRAVVAASPDDTLLSAYGRMRMADVSQLPVLDGDKIIGIIDESDLLLSLYQNQEHFADPVSGFMTDRLEMLAPSEPMENLLPILRADRVAIIVEDGHFLGLITKVDLLNHLRRNAVVEA
ncbi:MAG: pyridoxal-phosphate dependent enzyme [Rhodospirillaceae bacterium]|jgi:cystathionine beta-synthase|nr:pyridoxal-phosphate dependent enzyme [Rhodospirillaceae bacterium]MBT4043223.1 pyridoxal-phosphate dependent enzyme [Rhodospirillaceae bacterium]MBT4690753.1 pyridoxal-phosphate dependent enzyme [Rhodospirillaceae bacterium]MBT5078950.1 pyridoxal-phosphate dependent enzyme [Rhodospirillaceae bacterium]MBT5522959.1 pyridoxal-phosphate dependent enzyme [Rhodospirillaceae bacterium]